MEWADDKSFLTPRTLFIAAPAAADGHRDTQDNLADPNASRRSLINYYNSIILGVWCGYSRHQDVPALSRMKLVGLGRGVGASCGAARRIQSHWVLKVVESLLDM